MKYSSAFCASSRFTSAFISSGNEAPPDQYRREVGARLKRNVRLLTNGASDQVCQIVRASAARGPGSLQEVARQLTIAALASARPLRGACQPVLQGSRAVMALRKDTTDRSERSRKLNDASPFLLAILLFPCCHSDTCPSAGAGGFCVGM